MSNTDKYFSNFDQRLKDSISLAKASLKAKLDARIADAEYKLRIDNEATRKIMGPNANLQDVLEDIDEREKSIKDGEKGSYWLDKGEYLGADLENVPSTKMSIEDIQINRPDNPKRL